VFIVHGLCFSSSSLAKRCCHDVPGMLPLVKPKTRYLLYKDVNRNPLTWSKKPFPTNTNTSKKGTCANYEELSGSCPEEERIQLFMRNLRTNQHEMWNCALVTIITSHLWWLVRAWIVNFFSVDLYLVGITCQVAHVLAHSMKIMECVINTHRF
jgi:hypothetical protein